MFLFRKKTPYDEIKAARGPFGSLDARLDDIAGSNRKFVVSTDDDWNQGSHSNTKSVDGSLTMVDPALAAIYESQPFEADFDTLNFGIVTWGSVIPSGCSVAIKTATSTDGASWEAWQTATKGEVALSSDAKMIKFQVTLTGSGGQAPSVSDLIINYSVNLTTIYDEVINARGGFTDLDARIDMLQGGRIEELFNMVDVLRINQAKLKFQTDTLAVANQNNFKNMYDDIFENEDQIDTAKSDGYVWENGDVNKLILPPLKACGHNGFGQLGDGTTIDKNTLKGIYLSNVQQIVCGAYHTMFLMNDGTVKACGYNNHGQLGDGTTTNKSTPVDIGLSNVQQIVCGASHTMFLINDGTVKACGSNAYGQLGDGTTTDRSTPVDIGLSNVQQIVCGIDGNSNYTMFLMNDGTVKACGYNYYGQLGDGTNTHKSTPVDIGLSNVQQIACGAHHTMFLMNDGTVKTCGYNNYGQLGDGTTTNKSTPVDIGLSNVQQIVCGGSHTMFLINDGTVKACGFNGLGQLGDGTTTNKSTPVDIGLSDVKQIVCGSYHTMFLMPNTDGDATVISTATTTHSTPTEVILVADSTLNTGTITYEVSRDGGTTWTTVTPEAKTDISAQPSGNQLVMKATITGDATLSAWAILWG